MSDEIKQLERMIEVVARMIPKERQALEIYRKTAASAPTELTRILFERLALQEEEHEAKLRAALKILQAEVREIRERPKKGREEKG